MIIRHPDLEEVEAIRDLFEDEVRAGRMLPRSAEEVGAHLGDWLVAEENGQVIGCVSLVFFKVALCEVRSLAVHPAYRSRGIASQLVRAALDMAHERGIRQVLALTRAAHLFEQLGFQRDAVTHFPEKVWHDCAPCPFRHACDETTLVLDLAACPEELWLPTA
jgi:N-acetylglutamate synthase-like GNAT family acetyltransferase